MQKVSTYLSTKEFEMSRIFSRVLSFKFETTYDENTIYATSYRKYVGISIRYGTQYAD